MLALIGALSRSPQTEEREQLSTVRFGDRAFDRSEQAAGVFCQAGSFQRDGSGDCGPRVSRELGYRSHRDRRRRRCADAARALGEPVGGIAVSGAFSPRI